MGVESLFGLLIACALGALAGSASFKRHRPRILYQLMNAGQTRSRVDPPPESEKHELLIELFRRVDEMPPHELSPTAAYVLKRARKEGTAPIYRRAEELFSELEDRMQDGTPFSSLNARGIYRTALRLALLGIADDRIQELRTEVLSWGFDELAPIAGANLDLRREEATKASGIAVPISLR